ncbi:HupE/UreJ family protein [Endozoicomonas sp. 8E]|uniref:HupE/UreJ family protein n=1 Tax=Endozoicomonas sp. 8E TaxID=3035692 RepID=UPI0029391706|nr:HupE/UreJ family protein [Endozoicomonas sp. 8E]WOG28677.1 HupE/UreJ family protein [Endozoicomonas sp. 8E]
MKKLRAVSTATAAVLASSLAFAHPGDHSEGSVFSLLMHFLTEPDHMVFIGVAGALACFSYRIYKKIAGKKRQS